MASRILPVKIHDLDAEDKDLLENELGGVLRAIDFIYKEAGVNRALKITDNKNENQNKTDYRNQVNKVANAIKEVVASLKKPAITSAPTSRRPAEAVASSVTATVSAQPGSTKKKATLALLAIGAIVALSYFLYQKRSTANDPPTPIEKSIAVLPFADMSPNHDQEYFGDGIADEIINVLSQANDLRVIARSSSFQFKGKNEDVRILGEKLGVATVLLGSVKKSNNRLRVTAQLVKVSDGSHLWSKTFDRGQEDIFAIQDEIAAVVVTNLRVALSGLPTSFVANRNEEAYKLYQQGRYFYDRNGVGDAKTAAMYFSKSLAIDSSQAIVLSYLMNCGLQTPDAGERMVKKSLELDPTLGEARIDNAILNMSKFEFGIAKKELEVALGYGRNSSRVLRNAAIILNCLGKQEMALQYARQAFTIDPLQPWTLRWLGDTYYYNKQYDSAIVTYRMMMNLSKDFAGGHAVLARALTMAGRFAEARVEIEKDSSNDVTTYCMLEFAVGNKDKSDLYLKLIHDAKDEVSPYELALVYAYRGEKKEALKWLNLAFEKKDVRMVNIMVFIKVDPMLDPLRQDAEFIALLEKMKFPE